MLKRTLLQTGFTGLWLGLTMWYVAVRFHYSAAFPKTALQFWLIVIICRFAYLIVTNYRKITIID